ncbi:MAG: GNAT family N-acetyltransferase [Methanomassiliicoccales archaeon]
MRSYFLTTERLGFSIWNAEDLPNAMKLWGDPEVTRYLVAGGRMSPDGVRERLCQEIDNLRKHNVQYYPIFLRSNGEFVGCCGLRLHGDDPLALEMGVHLIKEQWGKGIATEACTAVIGYAFDKLHVEWLFAGHNPHNLVSARLLARLGFCFMQDEYYPQTGLMHPSYRLERSRGQP